MKNKKQLKLPLFPGREHPTGISEHINTPGAPQHSRIRIPFLNFYNGNGSAFCANFNLAVLHLQDHPFSPCYVSVQWSLKYGSSLCQDIYLVLLSVEIILK